MKVQHILEKSHSGYQHKKVEDDRPLTRLLKCDRCEGFMVGYKNNQKNLHYYRCLKCNGVSLNAKSHPKARKKSAEQLFIELLEKYQVSKNLLPLIEIQLTKLFNHYNADHAANDNQLQKQHTLLQSQLKQLKIRFGLGQIDRDTYDLTVDHLIRQIQEINREMGSGNEKTSNLEKLISQSL